MPKTLPSVPGREPYARVDAWASADGVVLYGGTSDGYLFRFEPKENRITNLGKPLNQYRVRGSSYPRTGKSMESAATMTKWRGCSPTIHAPAATNCWA